MAGHIQIALPGNKMRTLCHFCRDQSSVIVVDLLKYIFFAVSLHFSVFFQYHVQGVQITSTLCT